MQRDGVESVTDWVRNEQMPLDSGTMREGVCDFVPPSCALAVAVAVAVTVVGRSCFLLLA